MVLKILSHLALLTVFVPVTGQSVRTKTDTPVGTPVELALQSAQPQNVTVNPTTYLGRPSLQVIDDGSPDLGDAGRLALLPDSFFENGVVEVDLAGDTVPNAAPTARGFVGLAFRVSSEQKSFECFYLRPKNGRSEDQLQRNHSVQYISLPGFPWEKLRAEHPGQFESYTDLVPGQWTHVRIEFHGSTARLYVNHSEQPALIVNDLKQGARAGAIALWIGPGTVAHFADLTIQRTK